MADNGAYSEVHALGLYPVHTPISCDNYKKYIINTLKLVHAKLDLFAIAKFAVNLWYMYVSHIPWYIHALP